MHYAREERQPDRAGESARRHLRLTSTDSLRLSLSSPRWPFFAHLHPWFVSCPDTFTILVYFRIARSSRGSSLPRHRGTLEKSENLLRRKTGNSQRILAVLPKPRQHERNIMLSTAHERQTDPPPAGGGGGGGQRARLITTVHRSKIVDPHLPVHDHQRHQTVLRTYVPSCKFWEYPVALPADAAHETVRIYLARCP